VPPEIILLMPEDFPTAPRWRQMDGHIKRWRSLGWDVPVLLLKLGTPWRLSDTARSCSASTTFLGRCPKGIDGRRYKNALRPLVPLPRFMVDLLLSFNITLHPSISYRQPYGHSQFWTVQCCLPTLQ